jgi:multiple sugar transport system permease protein
MQIPWIQQSRLGLVFAGRRGRHLREYLTAYLLLAPGLLLIFTFGIFPVGFALYVSLHKWLIVRDEFRGIANYVEAIDNLAYISLFALGLAALAGAALLVRKVYRQARADGVNPWPLSLPAALHAAAVAALLRWAFFQLPEFLDIAPKMRGLERTRQLFLQLLTEAFQAETVHPHWVVFVRVALLALAAGLVAGWLLRIPRAASYQLNLALVWLAAAAGVGLLLFTYSAVGQAYALGVETGEDPGIWPQLTSVFSGVILLAAAWRLWRGAEGQASNLRLAARVFGAGLLMVGAVLLIIEIPTIVASGDPDLWNGLKVTVFFSAGTVPVQLTIALFLAVLLFQRVRGTGVFRVLYFLPYITPSIASATIFRLMFSERQQSPANRALELIGMEPQRWLREPNGIFNLLLGGGYPESVLPGWLPTDLHTLLADWMGGPSQALMVVIALSVWTFVGYNVVIYLAGLGNIPAELTEVAQIDGADKWEIFRHITFPLLSPTTYFLSLIAVIGTFKAFNILWLLRQSVGSGIGTLNTIGVVIFEEFFVKTRYGYASAMAFILFGFILALTLINNRVQGSRVFYG